MAAQNLEAVPNAEKIAGAISFINWKGSLRVSTKYNIGRMTNPWTK